MPPASGTIGAGFPPLGPAEKTVTTYTCRSAFSAVLGRLTGIALAEEGLGYNSSTSQLAAGSVRILAPGPQTTGRGLVPLLSQEQITTRERSLCVSTFQCCWVLQMVRRCLPQVHLESASRATAEEERESRALLYE